MAMDLNLQFPKSQPMMVDWTWHNKKALYVMVTIRSDKWLAIVTILNTIKADIEDPKKKRAREAAKKERKRRADSQKRKQTRDTSKEAVERQRLLLEQKRAAASGGGDCGQSFYVSMDEMEMAQIESEREKHFQRSRPRAESSTAQKTSRIFEEGICTSWGIYHSLP